MSLDGKAPETRPVEDGPRPVVPHHSLADSTTATVPLPRPHNRAPQC